MVLCLNSLISTIAGIGLLIQTGTLGSAFTSGGTKSYAVVLCFILIVFYVCAIFIAFKAYREFKGMMYDNGMGGAGGGIGNLLMSRPSNPQGQQPPRDDEVAMRQNPNY